MKTKCYQLQQNCRKVQINANKCKQGQLRSTNINHDQLRSTKINSDQPGASKINQGWSKRLFQYTTGFSLRAKFNQVRTQQTPFSRCFGLKTLKIRGVTFKKRKNDLIGGHLVIRKVNWYVYLQVYASSNLTIIQVVRGKCSQCP